MKNQENINTLLDSLFFIFEVDDETSMGLDKENPYVVRNFVNEIIDTRKTFYNGLSDNEQKEVIETIEVIKELLAEHNSEKHILTDNELKQVYVWLKDRVLHPKGKFVNGRFYLKDEELVDVREPSRRFPYTQMVAGRSSKFVKAMAKKYKPTSLKEFLNYFVIADKEFIECYFDEQ